MLNVKGGFTGIQPTLEAIKKADKRLYNTTRSEMNKALKVVASKAKGYVPSEPPLSNWKTERSKGPRQLAGWNSGPAQASIKTRLTIRSKKRNTRNIFKAQIYSDDSGLATFERAGRETTKSTFTRNINNKHPLQGRGRVVFKAIDETKEDISAQIETIAGIAYKKLQDELNNASGK